MSHVHHDLTPYQLAVSAARLIQYEINGWESQRRHGEVYTSKAPTRRDEDRHNARINGAYLMLSVILYNDEVHLSEAEAFVASAPWREAP